MIHRKWMDYDQDRRQFKTEKERLFALENRTDMQSMAIGVLTLVILFLLFF